MTPKTKKQLLDLLDKYTELETGPYWCLDYEAIKTKRQEVIDVINNAYTELAKFQLLRETYPFSFRRMEKLLGLEV